MKPLLVVAKYCQGFFSSLKRIYCGACPVSLTAMDIVKLFEEDVVARKRLAELLVGEPDIRLAIINAVLRDVATKSDIEKLRNEFRNEIARLEQRMDRLEERVTRLEEKVSSLDKRVDMVFKFMLMLNTPILVAVIGILLKMVLTS